MKNKYKKAAITLGALLLLATYGVVDHYYTVPFDLQMHWTLLVALGIITVSACVITFCMGIQVRAKKAGWLTPDLSPIPAPKPNPDDDFMPLLWGLGIFILFFGLMLQGIPMLGIESGKMVGGGLFVLGCEAMILCLFILITSFKDSNWEVTIGVIVHAYTTVALSITALWYGLWTFGIALLALEVGVALVTISYIKQFNQLDEAQQHHS